MIDDCAAEITLEAHEPWSPMPDPSHTGEAAPRARARRTSKKRNTGPIYCGDCGAVLPPDSTRGCCAHRDWRFDCMLPAEVIESLEWDDLDGDEQTVAIALINFPGTEASESELLERLNWPCERLYAVAAPRARQAAEFACCLYVQEAFRLTDQARDAFEARFEGSASYRR